MEASRREHDRVPVPRWVERVSAPPRGGYAAWVSWLEAFRRGEDPPTEGLGPVRGGFGSYVEARLLDRLSAAFAERVRQWQTALGDRIVAAKVAEVSGFPEELALQLSHIMLSHQGEREYGSPEQPKTLEALLVNLVDNLDARAAMFLETTRNVAAGGWSHHDNPLQRALYVPDEPSKAPETDRTREDVLE